MARRRLSCEEKKERCLPPKPEVLIVVGPGGVLEVYTNRHVKLHIATRLRVGDKEWLLADEYMERQLPKWAKEIYWPGLLQTQDCIRLLTPEEEFERRRNLWLLREFQKLDFTEVKNEKRVKEAGEAECGGEGGPQDFDF